MAFNLRNRSFLTLADFNTREMEYMLNLAEDLKKAKYAGYEGKNLEGKNIEEMIKEGLEKLVSIPAGGAAAPAASGAAAAEEKKEEEKKEEEEEEEEDVDMSGGGLFGDDDDDW